MHAILLTQIDPEKVHLPVNFVSTTAKIIGVITTMPMLYK